MVRNLKVEFCHLEALVPSDRNARAHSRRQIRQIAASIEEFGFVNPILIDDAGEIIAGHGRLEAAKLLKIGSVPVIRLCGLSEAQKRALRLADNKICANAGWDPEFVAQELEFLSSVEIDFNVEVTGFETAEIDLLIEASEARDKENPDDEVPDVAEDVPAVTQPGDLWVLGENRLLCGDALKPESYARLMDGAKARMVFTDPPYNVPVDGHVCGLGKIKHREFAMASGEMSEAEFAAFLETVLTTLAHSCVHGAILDVCMDWRHLYELLSASRNAKLTLLNLCIWAKTNAGMGSFYRSQHELVFVFKNGTAPHINNVELGRHGRNRTNVWRYDGVNSLRAGRLDDLHMHPTVKPVALVADAIRDCSRRGGIVLDCFAGSGTTLIAAEKTGRRAYAMELDPRYVDTAIRRWQEFTGKDAVDAETGVSFVEAEEACNRANDKGPTDAR